MLYEVITRELGLQISFVEKAGQSIGLGDARRWLYGSEGTLGIITRAVVKLTRNNFV